MRRSRMPTSALAAKRLLDEAGGAAIANLLRDLGDGVEFEDAFLHRIGNRSPSFRRRFSKVSGINAAALAI